MSEQNQNSQKTMPVLAMRGMVLFPQMVLHFDVGRERSILALEEAMEHNNRTIFLTTQKDMRDDDPQWDDVYNVGVVAEIKQIIKAQGYLRVLVEGLYRAKIADMVEINPFMLATIEEFSNSSTRGISAKMIHTLERMIKVSFEEYVTLSPRMKSEILFGALPIDDPLLLTEYVTANLPITFEVKQEILEETSVLTRLRMLVKMLEEEKEMLVMEHEIHDSVREQIDKNQKEYYLREQMKAIAEELGESPQPIEETAAYHIRIKALELEEEVEEKLLKEVGRLAQMPPNAHEASVVKTWLDTVLDLPWSTATEERVDVGLARKQLEKDHYGMKKVKERILEMIAVRSLAPEQKGQVICLVGPPGVGKTSIAHSVAESMNRNYVRMSLGGVRDESDIRGHRKTYIGAMPGRIMTSLSQAKSNNPLMLLDEVDKLGNDFRGDPSSALLEVLDTAQNHAFRDHYIEVPFDLSDVLFIATANNLATIPQPLLDRMEIIELGSYTREEKYQIADRHLLKKQLKRHGLNGKQLSITEAGLYALIDHYTREAGVRELERQLATLSRKTAALIVEKKVKSVRVTPKKLEELLGAHRFKQDDLAKTDEVALVNGLAWTSVGGEILQIEVAILEGTGNLVLTGSLGDVMKESARTAISYVRSVASKYNIEEDFYKTKDIHIHVPEGAVPKDGPSAGITITTALVSALAHIPAQGTTAMTGEISLRGRVLPIGGLREKAMAAYRNGITTVIIPEANLPDLEDVDDIVKEHVIFKPANHISKVLDLALLKEKRRKPPITTPQFGIAIPNVTPLNNEATEKPLQLQ